MCSNVLLIIYSHLLTALIVYASVEFREDLYEGSQCLLENGNPGICKKVPDCPPRLHEVLEGKRTSESTGRCGFEKFMEIVCCPANITDKIELRAADAACQEYDKEEPENDLSYHIFVGIEARSGEFPYMVALGYRDNDTDSNEPPIKYTCGGSLISSQHVLTAAHCVNNIHEKVPVEVRLGNNDINSVEGNVQRIPISDIITHPKFKRSTIYNDVAILKLKSAVKFSDTVKPICLQTNSLDSINITTSNASLVVIGWGSTSFDNDGSAKLMRTYNLSLVEKEECTKSYKGAMKLPVGVDDTLICAVDSNKTRKSDACQGDSGGPLLLLTGSTDTVIGITSFGQSCGGPVPGIYTSTYPFLDWIEEHVWLNNDTYFDVNIEISINTKT